VQRSKCDVVGPETATNLGEGSEKEEGSKEKGERKGEKQKLGGVTDAQAEVISAIVVGYGKCVTFHAECVTFTERVTL